MPEETDRRMGAAVYKAIVERYETRPNQCTIYQSDVPEGKRTTTWLSADEGSYVDLCLMR